MRDLLISEQSHVYGATGRSKSCYTPPKSCKASKSKTSKKCKPKQSKTKKRWC